MSAMQAEVFEASRAIDVPEDEAPRAAASLARALTGGIDTASARRPAEAAAAECDVATVESDGSSPRAEPGAAKGGASLPEADVTGSEVGVARIECESALLRWMTGFGLASPAAIAPKLFLH